MQPDNAALLDSLFRQHHPRLVRFARTRCPDMPTAEDVTMQAFTNYAERLERGTVLCDPHAACQYIAQSIINGAITHTRKGVDKKTGESRTVSIEQIVESGGDRWEPADTSALPHSSIERRELRVQVRKALAALPEYHRTPILLHHFYGLSHEEVAERTGQCLGTIKSRLSRGRAEFGKNLEHVQQDAVSAPQPVFIPLQPQWQTMPAEQPARPAKLKALTRKQQERRDQLQRHIDEVQLRLDTKSRELNETTDTGEACRLRRVVYHANNALKEARAELRQYV